MGHKTIKIAYFIDRIIEGGTELQLVDQINHLEGDGIEQILFCMYKSEEHDDIPIKCRTEILEICSLANAETLKKAWDVARFLRKENVDIVQTYFFDSNCLGVLCGRVAHVKKIISCRRDLGFWYTKNLLLFLQICNALTDRILVNSNSVKDNVLRLEKVYPNKIDIIKNGIDASSYRYEPSFRVAARNELSVDQDDVCIGLIANMSRPVKRVDLFVEAARIILSKGIHAKFFILGDGYLRDELQERVDSYCLASQIIFLGKKFDKRRLLSALDIAVLSSDAEGFSNAIMEYMAAGIPTVASNVDGNLELIKPGNNGLLFEKGNAEDLSKKLLELILHPSLCLKLGGRAVEDIASYDWSNRKKEITEYYTQLLGKGRNDQ